MWLRIKREGMQIAMIDSESITGWEIDVDEFGDYALTAITGQTMLQFICGTSDECHAMLNKIMKQTKYNVFDV